MAKKIVELFYAAADLSCEWNEFYVYRHPRESSKYAVDYDSGCSCDGYEIPTLALLEAFTPLGKREVYAEFSKWFDAINNYDKPGTKIDVLERLRAAL